MERGSYPISISDPSRRGRYLVLRCSYSGFSVYFLPQANIRSNPASIFKVAFCSQALGPCPHPLSLPSVLLLLLCEKPAL